MPPEDNITDKSSQSGRIHVLYSLYKKIFFDVAPWESAAFTNLFSRSQTFSPCHQEKELAPIIKEFTVKSNLNTIQKYQKLTFSWYPKQVMLRTHPLPFKFLFMALWDVFNVSYDVISWYFKEWP